MVDVPETNMSSSLSAGVLTFTVNRSEPSSVAGFAFRVEAFTIVDGAGFRCPGLKCAVSSSPVASGPTLTPVACGEKLVPGSGDLPALRRSPRGASTRGLPRPAP